MGFFKNLFSKKQDSTTLRLTAANVLLDANQFLRFKSDSKGKMEAHIALTVAHLSRSGAPAVRLVLFRCTDLKDEYPWLLLKSGTFQALHTYWGTDSFSDQTFARLYGDKPRSIAWADNIAENCPRPGEFITEWGRQTYEMLVQHIQAGRYVIDRVVKV